MMNLKGPFIIFMKGIAMGAANVIPGVSGGTIALITGIFERLINAVKSFNLTALKLLASRKFKEFAKHTDLFFLIYIFAGIIVSIISLAKLLEFSFNNYPVFIWSYFFGLILASVYFIGKTVSRVNIPVVVFFITGVAIAIMITLLNPATENRSLFYLFVCGIVAMCSMILPGLSGSFVLILMGNYQLVMIEAVTDMRIDILIPVALGAIFGLIAFSHLLSWIFRKYKDQTISLLTGFILGSLAILWPWKVSYNAAGEVIQTNRYGAFIDQSGEIIENIKVFRYDLAIPGQFTNVALWALVFMIGGILSIVLIEKYAQSKT